MKKKFWLLAAVLALALLLATRTLWLDPLLLTLRDYGAGGEPVQATESPLSTPTPPAVIDLTAADTQGRVWVRYTGTAEPPIKVQVLAQGEGATPYNYDLPADGTPIALPLTQGEGVYTVAVLEHVEDNRYKSVLSRELDLTLADPLAPYLYANRMVDYEGTQAAALAGRLTEALAGTGEKVDCLLRYVAETIAYDEEKSAAAANGEMTGYLPALDAVLAQEKGICYDYAALLCGMLRSQGIPCKLQVGWTGELYHAWVEVWSDEGAELTGGIRLNGEDWTLLDPTFLSTRGCSDILTAYMAEPANYRVRYTY